MNLRKFLVHRYDNLPDILAIEKNGCSEVYQRCRDSSFDALLVIPTGSARTSIAVVADPVSKQYRSNHKTSWPGRPDRYNWRVDVKNVRYTDMRHVREAFEKAAERWVVPWTIKVVTLDLNDLML